jgi:hypothetical protein
MLAQLKTDRVWLHEQVLTAVRRGDERAAIHGANLIPPGLLGGQPDVYQPYLILREHVIDRLYDQNVGYWQPDLQGLDHLGRADRAELLVDFLGISEKQLVETVERMAADGKYELAALLLESSGSRFEHSTSVANAKRLAYLKLMKRIRIRTRSNSSFTRERSENKHRRWPVADDERRLSRPGGWQPASPNHAPLRPRQDELKSYQLFRLDYCTVTATALDGIPFVTTTRVLAPVSVLADTVKCVDTGSVPVATAMVLGLTVRA